jgi:hypothetical protein
MPEGVIARFYANLASPLLIPPQDTYTRLQIANGGDRDEIDKDVNDTRPSIGRAVRDVFFRFWDLRNHYA